MRLAVLVEVDKVVHHIRQGNSAAAVHILIDCLEQHRLVGIAHVHRFNKLHELVRHILRRDKIPAILFGNIADAFLPEIVEHPLITKGNRKVRLDFSVLDVTLHRLGLHIHHPDELNLRDHILDAVLPVEKVNDFIVRHIDWHIQPCLRLFALEQHILIQLALVLRRQHIRHGLIFCNVQHPVQAVRHIEHIGVVHKVNHQQVFFPRAAACATAKLLQIDCFGHGRACHEQHRGMRAVPAFIQKVAGAENIGRAGFIVL